MRPVGGAIAKCADICKSLAAGWMTRRSVGGAIAKCADISKSLAADWMKMRSVGGATVMSAASPQIWA